MKWTLAVSFIIHLGLIILLGLIHRDQEVHPQPEVIVEITSAGPTKLKRLAKKSQAKKVTTPRTPEDFAIKSTKTKKGDNSGESADKEVTAQAASGGSTHKASARQQYIAELYSYIDKNQYYPRQALRMRQTGLVTMKLTIERDGAFKNIAILKASPYSYLNKAAKNLLVQLGRFKPLPRVFNHSTEFTVDINYQLKN